MNKTKRAEILEKAKTQYLNNKIEIDSMVIISKGEDGYWVRAWVFVEK